MRRRPRARTVVLAGLACRPVRRLRPPRRAGGDADRNARHGGAERRRASLGDRRAGLRVRGGGRHANGRGRARGLRLTSGATIRVSENARIRFARGTLPTGKGPDLNVELGSADVEAASEDVAIVTSLGVARVERGARVRVSSDGERSTLEVVVGRAVVLASGGDSSSARVKAR